MATGSLNQAQPWTEITLEILALLITRVQQIQVQKTFPNDKYLTFISSGQLIEKAWLIKAKTKKINKKKEHYQW